MNLDLDIKLWEGDRKDPEKTDLMPLLLLRKKEIRWVNKLGN